MLKPETIKKECIKEGEELDDGQLPDWMNTLVVITWVANLAPRVPLSPLLGGDRDAPN